MEEEYLANSLITCMPIFIQNNAKCTYFHPKMYRVDQKKVCSQKTKIGHTFFWSTLYISTLYLHIYVKSTYLLTRWRPTRGTAWLWPTWTGSSPGCTSASPTTRSRPASARGSRSAPTVHRAVNKWQTFAKSLNNSRFFFSKGKDPESCLSVMDLCGQVFTSCVYPPFCV